MGNVTSCFLTTENYQCLGPERLEDVGTALADIKMHYTTLEFKILWYWLRKRPKYRWNRIEYLSTYIHTCTRKYLAHIIFFVRDKSHRKRI